MSLTIQILLVILLLVGIVAVLRLYFVLGDVRTTLEGVEETRKELNSTVQRLNTLVSEEITPTLQSARATLENLEILHARSFTGDTSNLLHNRRIQFSQRKRPDTLSQQEPLSAVCSAARFKAGDGPDCYCRLQRDLRTTRPVRRRNNWRLRLLKKAATETKRCPPKAAINLYRLRKSLRSNNKRFRRNEYGK